MIGPYKQANLPTHGCNEVTLVCGSLRLTPHPRPINIAIQHVFSDSSHCFVHAWFVLDSLVGAVWVEQMRLRMFGWTDHPLISGRIHAFE